MAFTLTAINRYPTKAAISPVQDTAAEASATLARHRSSDGRTWFDVNLVPDTQGVTVSVGDEAEALSAVDPGEEPLR